MTKFILLLALTCSIATGQTTFWRSLGGPDRGSITKVVAVGDSILYVGTDTSGVFRSTDSGTSWTSLSAGLPDGHVQALAVGPSGALYAGTRSKGLFRLPPAGSDWDSTTYRYSSVTAIAVNSLGTIFFGVLGATFTGAEGSTNWVYTDQNRFYNETVHAVYVTPTNDVVAGADATIGWYTIGDPYWYSEFGFMSNTRSIVSGASQRIYIGGEAVGGNRGAVLYIDNLRGWASYTQADVPSPIYALSTNTRGWLFAATRDSGIFVSGANGDSWVSINDGLGAAQITSFAMTPHDILYAGSSDGNVYRSGSTDFGLLAPIKLSPPDAVLNLQGDVTLRWRSVAGSTLYHVQVSSDSLFVSPIVLDITVQDTFSVVAGLDTVTRFFWRVQSLNVTDTSLYSDAWRFVTGPLPSAPVLESPPDGAENLSNVEFRWRSIPKAVSYHLETSGYPEFYYSTNYDIADTSVRWHDLSPNIRIYWRVRATNIAGTGDFSEVRSFGTITPPQAEPRLDVPANGEADVPIAAFFRWGSSERATSYEFQLTDLNQFDSLLVRSDSAIADTTLTVSGLTNGTQYHWRVRGGNQWGYSPYSGVRSFSTIVDTPQVPQPSTPPNGAVDVPTVNLRLKWNPVPGAVTYHAQLSTDSLFAKIWLEQDVTSTSMTVWSVRENTVYYWRVHGVNRAGVGPWSPLSSFKTVHEGNYAPGTPPTYYVWNNFPNLTNGQTSFAYGTPVPTHVVITVFNLLGMKVATVIDEDIPSGYFLTQWDVTNLPSGSYFYTVELGDLRAVKRFIVVK